MNYSFNPPLDPILLAQLSKKLCKLCHNELALTESNKELSPLRYAIPNSVNSNAFQMAHPSKPSLEGLCYLCSKRQANLFTKDYPINGRPKTKLNKEGWLRCDL